MEIILLLLAVGLWLIVRTVAKKSVRKSSEFIDDRFEEWEIEQQSVRSYEKNYIRYTTIIVVCLIILSILLTIATLGPEDSPHYIFEEFRYIFIFKKLYFITIEEFLKMFAYFIVCYVVISAQDLVIMIIREKQTKKILRFFGIILLIIFVIITQLFTVVIDLFSDNSGKCKIYERNGHSLILNQVTGALTTEIYIFEAKSMTDVNLMEILDDCKLDDIIDVEWEGNKAVITYEESNFLQGSWEESVEVYFSD